MNVLSQQTRALFKHLKSVSDSVIIRPITAFVSIEGGLVAFVDISAYENPEMPEFGIYRLGELLNLADSISAEQIEIDENGILHLKGQNVTSKYATTDIGNLSTYDKPATMIDKIKKADEVLKLEISEDLIEQLKKASGILGLEDIQIKRSNGNVTIKATSMETSMGTTTNDVEFNLGNIDGDDFMIYISRNALSQLKGNFDLTVVRSPLNKSSFNTLWESKDLPIKYVIYTKKV